MDDDYLIAKLQSLTERDLIDAVIVPLLRAIGFHRVTHEGGAHESGRDLVCLRELPTGKVEVVAVLVKSFRPNSGLISRRAIAPTLRQLRQALETPVSLPDGGEVLPDLVYFVTPFRISAGAGIELMGGLSDSGQDRAALIDGDGLERLVNEHLPTLAASLTRSTDSEDGSAHTRASPREEQEISDASKAMDFLAGLRADIDNLLGSSQPIDPTLCFVIMSFSGSPLLADFYEKAIKPTIEGLGYRCERIDEQVFNGRIMERIFLNLRIARLVVADLTEARPNCYYELGVAHALKKQVIPLAYAGEELHFDVKDWNFIIYSRLDELADELRQRILGTVGRGDAPAR